MIQLFAVGETAILQSLDASSDLWNALVTVTSCKWSECPIDIHGMPQVSTYIYEIDIHEGYYIQAALKKLDTPIIAIKEKQVEEA